MSDDDEDEDQDDEEADMSDGEAEQAQRLAGQAAKAGAAATQQVWHLSSYEPLSYILHEFARPCSSS